MSVRSKPKREGEAPAEPERDGSELPEGWATVRLPDVAELVMGQSPPSTTYNTEQRGLPFFQGKAEFGELYPTPRKFCDTPGKIAEPDDILMTIRAPVGPTNLCATRSCIGRGLAAIRARGEVPPLYLLYFFRSIEEWLSRQGTGSTFTAINKDNLSSIELPLAPLAEQRRIVGKLELLLGKVSSSQQRLSRVPGLLKRFRQSVLAAACSGKLTADWREENENSPIDSLTEADIPVDFPTLPESWSWTTLESVCINVVDCPHSTPKWTDVGKLCIRTTNFRPGLLDLSEVRFVSPATFKERIERLRPEPGDIVYSREGGILGIACQIPPGVELCLGQRMMLFRVREEYTATLLMHWLNSPIIALRVQELTGGSASPHLNVRDIRAFPTPVPPLSEQQEIVRRVEKLFAFADQIEARLRQAQTHVDRLTQSLLGKAFRGELVPTEHALATAAGRNYESADELLVRIRATQASASPAKPKRGKTSKT